jgi:BON domain-containing protein
MKFLVAMTLAATLAAAATAVVADHQLPAREPGDVAIARRISEALAQARIGGVRVEATNGTVTLTGVVENDDALRNAVAAARAVPGVLEIDNRLVPAPRPRPDPD